VRIVLLAGRRSRYAGRVARRLEEKNVALSAAVVVSRRWRETFRMVRSAGRSAGWARTAELALGRLRAERGTPPLAIPSGAPVLSSRGTNSAETIRIVRELRADVIALAQPGIVGPGILAAASVGVLNAHPGWLPFYRGLDAGKWAMLRGEPDRLGASVHWVDRGVDTGPVISIRPLHGLPADPQGLDDRLDELAADLLADTLAAIAAGETLAARPQGKSEGHYYRKMNRQDEAAVARLLLPEGVFGPAASGERACGS